MMMPILLILFLSSLATLAIIHWVACEFYFYWKYLWIDIPIHMLGGISIALGISVLPLIRVTLPKFFGTYWGYVCIVILLGTIWEIFEYVGGISIVDKDFLPDTLLDYVMDIVGVLVGYGIVKSVTSLERI